MKSNKILFVDDDEFIRKIYTDRFEASGINVVVANSADTAKKLIQSETFDLICLDNMLAGQSGLDVLKWIRAEKKMTEPVVIFSASGNDHIIQDFIDAGATEYIQKDHIVPTQLVEKIKTLIAVKKI